MSAIEEIELPEELETERPHYEFDAAFQSKIAAMTLRDPLFVQRTDGLIDPAYFENTVEARLVSINLAYFKRYKRLPDRASLGELLKKAQATKVFKSEEVPLIGTTLKLLFTHDIADRDFVIDEVAEFARHQAILKAMEGSIHSLERKDFSAIQAAMQKAFNVGSVNVSTGYDYGEELASRTEERVDRAAGKHPPTGISTGFPKLDDLLYHKGWGKRELSVLMGAAKAGKSTALISFGINAIAHVHRYNVLYVTLEVAAKIIAERMDANISDHAMFELNTSIHDVKDKVARFLERAGKFVIHEFPTGSMAVSDLRRLLEHYKGRGLQFDLVIVDYADLMRPERVTDNNIENSKSVYVALRGLAMEEGLAILTATQTNREGAKKTVAGMTDVGDDFNKIRIADVVISINKTDEERVANRARLFFAACRNQQSGISVCIEQAIDRMKFITKIVAGE